MPKPVRDIPIRFLPAQVGQKTIDKVVNMWNWNIPISQIIRKLNPGRMPHETLSYVDIYAIIGQAIQADACKQRMSPKNELTLEEFKRLFTAWKYGASAAMIEQETLKGINKPKYQIVNIVRSLNKRHKDHKDKKANRKKKTVEAVTDRTLLQFAVRRKVDEADCLVIDLNGIPAHILTALEELSDFDPKLSLETKTPEEVQNKLLDLTEI